MRLTVLCVIALLASTLPLPAEETAVVHAADGFQFPVGPSGTAAGYYVARGFRPNGHLGEDWNGVGGGDTDLGDPVYAAAHGIVVFARNYHVGWGNVVIIRHAYYEGADLKYVDSLYGHLLDFTVQEGEQVHRGQQIGRIGNNFGMYEAHLHFEMRKNLQIGMYRSSFPRDFSNYYTPTEFITQHHICPKGNHMVNAPINTFAAVPPPILAGPHVPTPVVSVPPEGSAGRGAKISALPQTPGAPLPAPTPVFRTSKTYAAATPAPTPERAAAKKPAKSPETAIAAAATPSPTPAPSSKHGKKIVATATPEPKAPAKTEALASASPVVKLSDDSEADAATEAKASAPAPSSKHGKKIASAPAPEPAPETVLKFQPVATASAPAPTVKTAEASSADNPLVVAPSTPAPTAKSRKKLAATATPKPLPKTPVKQEELTADSIALPDSVPSPKQGKPLDDASSGAPGFKKGGENIDLIPEPIAANAGSTPVQPARRTRRSASSTPAPHSAIVINGGTLVVAPQPILPAPTADVAPIRSAGSSFKVDRYEDLRGK